MSRFKDGNIDNPKYRKNVIDCFVNSIYLYDDHIMLNYNSEEGAKTVTFSDILSSDLDDGSPPTSSRTALSSRRFSLKIITCPFRRSSVSPRTTLLCSLRYAGTHLFRLLAQEPTLQLGNPELCGWLFEFCQIREWFRIALSGNIRRAGKRHTRILRYKQKSEAWQNKIYASYLDKRDVLEYDLSKSWNGRSEKDGAQ